VSYVQIIEEDRDNLVEKGDIVIKEKERK
jgi:hypothetical protein